MTTPEEAAVAVVLDAMQLMTVTEIEEILAFKRRQVDEELDRLLDDGT